MASPICRSSLARPAAARDLEEGGDVGWVQTTELDAVDVPLAMEIGEQLGERMRRAEIRMAIRADHEKGGIARVACEMAQELERATWSPVQVVEHQQHGGRSRRGGQEQAHGLEQPHAV